MFISISHGIKLLSRINTFPSYFTLTLFITSFVKEEHISSLKFIFQNFLVYFLINIVDKQDCKPSTTYKWRDQYMESKWNLMYVVEGLQCYLIYLYYFLLINSYLTDNYAILVKYLHNRLYH